MLDFYAKIYTWILLLLFSGLLVLEYCSKFLMEFWCMNFALPSYYLNIIMRFWCWNFMLIFCPIFLLEFIYLYLNSDNWEAKSAALNDKHFLIHKLLIQRRISWEKGVSFLFKWANWEVKSVKRIVNIFTF